MNWGAYFLPQGKRDAIAALEVFVRDMRHALTGRGDCCGRDEVAGVGGRAVEQLFAAQVEASMAPLAVAVTRASIPRAWFVECLRGLADEPRVSRYATWASLQRQFALTGGNIAKIVAAILGATHSDAGAFAERMGVATMLVTTLRNLRRDVAMGFIRLPLEDLARFRYSERQLLAVETSDALRELVRFEVDRTRELFRDGSSGICWLAGDGSRMAVSAFVASRLAMLDAIERAGFDALHGDARVSMARKLREFSVAWRLARRSVDEPMPRVC